jgi:predicted AAA+ superfamily ATPase
MKRFQLDLIKKDLEKKMVFLVGPRQSGKTWLAKKIAKAYSNSLYLNYDSLEDKEIIDKQIWDRDLDLIIFDELHKKPEWKNFIKGVFDTKESGTRILVTGSARLEVFDKLGDSLAGRYFRHRLMPFSLAEFRQINEIVSLGLLMLRSGFPEPFLADDDLEASRWRQQYVNGLLTTDVFDLEPIQNIKAMRLLFDMLRLRVGSSISFNSLAEDLKISSNTVKKYIEILEALFIIFRVTPYSKNIARSILKEPKIYFFDTALVSHSEGAAFENLVALSLLKSIYAENDYLAEEKELHYLRTKDGLEVDFAVANKGELEYILEAKLSDKNISKSLLNFKEHYGYKAFQIVKNMGKSRIESGVKVCVAKEFLEGLYL